jgi:hypothetical protein
MREVASDSAGPPGEGHSRSRSALALVLGNLFPLFGVLFLDWDIGAVVVLYWSENLIIGALNIAKMITVAGAGGIPLSLFFLIHYGGFCAVHGLFIQTLLLDAQPAFGALNWPFFLVFVELLVVVCSQMFATAPAAWILAFIGLAISHGYSFFSNFIARGEYREATAKALMAAPYRRIMALHIAIIAGGFAVMSLGEPVVLLLVLIVLKTALDFALHRRSHRGAVTVAEAD